MRHFGRIPSIGMANLLKLALQRPDLFVKPARGEFRLSTSDDITLLHKAAMTDHLSAIMRSVYTESGAE